MRVALNLMTLSKGGIQRLVLYKDNLCTGCSKDIGKNLFPLETSFPFQILRMVL